MTVTAGDSIDVAELSFYTDRINACRGQYARIEVCKEHAVTEDDDLHCAYCGKELPTEEDLILGDVDGDGEVTSIDATYIQRLLADMAVPDSFNETAADVDGDDEVSVLDATLIQRWLADFNTPYNIGEPIS